VKEGVVSQIFW